MVNKLPETFCGREAVHGMAGSSESPSRFTAMASPTFLEIVTTTLQQSPGKPRYRAHNNALLNHIKNRGREAVQRQAPSFGRACTRRTAIPDKRYSGRGAEHLASDASAQPVLIRQSAVRSRGLEQLQNSHQGPSSTCWNRVRRTPRHVMMNGMAFDAYSDGTAIGQITGASGRRFNRPGSGTIGVSIATWIFWRKHIAYSAVTDGSAAATSTSTALANVVALQLVRGQMTALT